MVKIATLMDNKESVEVEFAVWGKWWFYCELVNLELPIWG
jgi:hypothetical protein